MIKTKLFTNITSALLFFLVNILNSQTNNLKFEKLTIEDGLSQNSSFCIIQDYQGLMWFGTEDGLNRYDGYNFKIFKTEPNDSNSIASNYVISIFEDSNGNLWAGTDGGGLNLYNRDKENFVRFLNNPKNQNSLSQNRVNSICEDASGNIWLATNGGGLDKYNPATKQFTHYKHDPKNPNSFSSNMLFSIVWDKSGFLWIGTDNGLNKFNLTDESFTRYLSDPKDHSSLNNNHILYLSLDRNGILWIGTFGGGLNKLVLSKGLDSKPVFISYKNDLNNPYSISGNVVTTIYEDKKGILWIGTDGDGLNRLDKNKYKSKVFFSHHKNNPIDPNSIVNNRIFSIFQDRSGVLWIGTKGGGISKFDSEKKNFVIVRNQPNVKNTLSHNAVRVLTEDKSGKLWIGTDGAGLDCYNPKTGIYKNYRNNPLNSNSLSYDFVRSIFQDRKGFLWIGTDGGGINKFNIKTGKFTRYEYDPENPNSLGHNTIRPIFEDSKGSLWIGTYGAGLDLFNQKTNNFVHFSNDTDNPKSISHNYIYCIREDRNGVLWIGTDGGGLNRYNRETKSFDRFQNDPDDPNSISQDNIYSIYEDESGILWLGTRGGGLNKFDPKTGTAIHYTEKDGMPNATVYGILGDDNGNIWVSTNKGISRFDPKEEKFKNYDINDGIQSNEFNGGSYCRSHTGELFFGGINGFNRFFPEDIKENNFIPPIALTSFKVYEEELKLEKSISVIKEIELSYKQNFISFEFASMDYNNPEKNQYAYKLEEFDKEWTYCGNRHYANYTNVSGGDYVFRVKGTNSDGIWNEEGTSVKITIIPPFWNTWWFRILLSLIVVFLIYMFYKIRINRIEKQRENLQLQVKERTSELTSTNKNLRKAKALTQRRAAQATMLNKLGQKISSNLDLTTLLNEIADVVQKEFQYKEVLIYMIDKRGKNLVLKSYAGSDSNDMITQCKIGEGMIGEAAQKGQIKLNNNELNSSDSIKEQIKSELAVPIKIGAKVFGVLDIQSDQNNAFDSADITTIETFGSQISSAINNARLFEQAQAEIKVRKVAENKSKKMALQTSMLNNIGQRISSELELDTLLNEIVESVRDAFDYYGVMLMLPDEKKKGLLLQSISGGYKNVFPEDLFIKYGEGMIGTAFTKKEIQVSGDVTKNENYVMKADEITKSELSVPIIDGKKAIGVLDIQSDKLDVFDKTDIATMETFSTQIAAAIKNASLYNQAQEEISERKRTQTELLKSRDSLTLAKKETDNIFNNVAEGLFLINNEFKIGSQYSKALEDIFEKIDLGELDILSYIEEKVQAKIFENTKQFMELMFDDSVHEETINELNPLSEIELTFRNNEGMVTDTKFLSFKFKRIIKHNKVNELIVTVVDITDQIILQKKLKESESKSKKQMEWLFSILHVDPQLLKDFIDSVQKEIESIEYYMKQGEQGQGYYQILENIYRSVHLIKGNASLLDLKFFVNSTHEYEDKIAELKEKDQLSGKDFVPLSLKLGDLRKNLNEINSLIKRIGKFHSNFRPKRSYENKLLINSIDNLIINLSKDFGTEVRFVHNDFDGESIPYEFRILTKDIFIQMVRNSMSHGIESKEERINKKKNPYGTIKVSSVIKNKKLILKYFDDGRGIQTDKLKEKIRSNDKWKNIDEFDENQINELIFETGISTSEKANVVSGRGLGMDIIKRKIEEHNGSVKFFSKQEEFCEFNITLPIYNNRETDEDIIETEEMLQI